MAWRIVGHLKPLLPCRPHSLWVTGFHGMGEPSPSSQKEEEISSLTAAATILCNVVASCWVARCQQVFRKIMPQVGKRSELCMGNEMLLKLHNCPGDINIQN